MSPSSGNKKMSRRRNAVSNSCFTTTFRFDPLTSSNVLPNSKLLKPHWIWCSFHALAKLLLSTESKIQRLPGRHWKPHGSSKWPRSISTTRVPERPAFGVTSLHGSVSPSSSPSVMLPQRSDELPLSSIDGRLDLGLFSFAKDGDLDDLGRETMSLERAICNQARATWAAGMATPVSANITLSVQVLDWACFESFESTSSPSLASPWADLPDLSSLASGRLSSCLLGGSVGKKVARAKTRRTSAKTYCPKTSTMAAPRTTAALICHASMAMKNATAGVDLSRF